MRKKSSIRSRWAVALWVGCTFLTIWVIFAAVITWCTAKTMDRYLEEENGQIASNIINAAQLQRLADNPEIQEEIKAYWIWDGTNSDWLDNSFGGGLLRNTNHDPQTAVAVYKAPLIYWAIGLVLPAVATKALSNAPLALSPTH